MMKETIRLLVIVVLAVLVFSVETVAQTHQARKQGFSMKMMLNNVGAMGRVAYPPFRSSPDPPPDSLGLEYPIGQRIEHLFGGGLWIGGILDTTRGPGSNPPLKLVTVCYEGWSGPYYEMYPGNTPADTIWRANRNTPKPADWDSYWGGAIPFKPISDDDFYCTYTDTAVRVTSHVPLRLKVIQSSYAWQDPYADAIIIFEYRIINMGYKRIDSSFVAFFFEPDIGPINASQYWIRNFTNYIQESRTAYSHNPVDQGSTPVGVALLRTSIPLDSLRYTFQWFPGPTTPPNDIGKFDFMSSGQIRPDEYPSLSDTRFIFSFGPFFIQPQVDTIKVAVAVVSGFSRRIDHRIVLQNNAARALDIYLNQGIRLPATPPSPPLHVTVGFRRVTLNWRWTPEDTLRGWRFPDPEQNWDSTNQVARDYPYRITNPPPGYDSARGGRNFSAYRVWRSEHPGSPPGALPPDESYTLLKQFDDPRDDFEYNTGLEYTFIDSNLVRGKVYVYAVTSRSIPNRAYVTVGDTTYPVPVEPLESAKAVNAKRIELPFAVSTELNKVSVVPNPYRTDRDYTLESGGFEGLSGEWDENKRVIKFINLPEECTIRIFSLAGDLIRTVHHDGRDPSTGFSRGDASVPLVSESNRALASGVYLFTVESKLGTQTGKFVIIR